MLSPADKMNTFAANALLKIVEEPPEHTVFILIAEQLSTIPATLLSRCQKYVFPSVVDEGGYTMLGSLYPDTSERATLFQQRFALTQALCDVIEGKASPCVLAAVWSAYAIENVVWMLYLITAEAIQKRLQGAPVLQDSLARLVAISSPVGLFRQLDNLHGLMKYIVQNRSMNQTLVLEDLLLSYLQDI